MPSKRKPRKISKTEKTLRGKLKYVRSKINKASAEILELSKKYNYDYSSQVTKKTNLNTEIQKIIEGKILKANKAENELLKKLQRFKYKPKTKIQIADPEEYDDRIELGKAWERKEIDDQLFNGIFKSVDGMNIKSKLPAILQRLLQLISLLESKKILVGYTKGRNIDLFVEEE